ncbi:hypothetical protein PM082_008570 [Marasmius tenuissimus]|nr:hypothetical protein PM082_008570 [Marasmius tenuissimus]
MTQCLSKKGMLDTATCQLTLFETTTRPPLPQSKLYGSANTSLIVPKVVVCGTSAWGDILMESSADVVETNYKAHVNPSSNELFRYFHRRLRTICTG